jgi:predicted SAM-dependent methyltransferase
VEKVVCVEKDDAQIDLAQKLWPFHTHLRWKHVICGEDYDGALCCEVLEHMAPEDGHKILRDIKRVLKTGAMLCVTVPWESGSRAVYPGHITMFSWALLGKMLREAGFTLDEKQSTDIKGIWLMAVCHA